MFNVVVVSSGVVLNSFDNGADASEYARATNDELRRDGSDERVRVMRVAAEDNAWKRREQGRFDYGPYVPVVWHRESWAINDHFAHISADDDSKIAFTRDGEHGRDDIQTRMNPGRYLTRYYSETLSEDDIKFWCAKWDEGKHTLEIAMGSEQIQWVFENGPNSCMAHNASEYDSPCHPVRVYGAGDLGVAYMMDGDDVTARCVVFPARNVHCRIYGDESRFQPLLIAAGYSRGGLTRDWDGGARLVMKRTQDGVIVVRSLVPMMTWSAQIGTAIIIARHALKI
jgi:hypothetical protein